MKPYEASVTAKPRNATPMKAWSRIRRRKTLCIVKNSALQEQEP